MAKLGTRGHGAREELARVEKVEDVQDAESGVEWRRVTFTLMSDRKVLRKLDVRFRADSFSGPRKHSYGWKNYSKVKEGVTPEQWVEAMGKAGFVKVLP
jgi:hypothetical protein